MIAVVDYGMGNLRSVQKALQHVGAKAEIVSTLGDVDQAEKIVLPGVGAFRDAISRLRDTGMDQTIISAVRRGVPILGICLGFQLLFDISYEDGQHTGFGLLPGKVIRFRFNPSLTGQHLKIPHMGWNQIYWRDPCPLFTNMPNGAWVYFVHSFHAIVMNSESIATSTEYGYTFPSAVWKDNIYATQFHPEKSQKAGLKILQNFVDL